MRFAARFVSFALCLASATCFSPAFVPSTSVVSKQASLLHSQSVYPVGHKFNLSPTFNTVLNSHKNGDNNDAASASSSSAFFSKIGKTFTTFTLAAFLVMSNIPFLPSEVVQVLPGGGAAEASDSRIVGEIKGSGLVFKDTLVVESFDDPKVKGVTLYVTNFQRPITDRLQKDFFSDPSAASISCAKTGPVLVADNIVEGPGGEQVFQESKSLFFKTLRTQRVYDKEKNTVVYVTFNTRIDKGGDDNKSRFKSSTCAVNLD
mmetsp:Transcript_30702/g.45443  ORF Transcript_30702/g.45443 Transcript_30702/m.45443 type:complete len:261 (-) Transcript_30702:188-970(-)|eukprot:CAMPEP_0195524728 /NCGR_PEP_ID=MMETSP0794_2-20130614/24745_1 /TAXON_ID=515487 /ORGANISM="Stephanopyxis turris, Strain CCMP 815" /LENGTH=260 /DNA_ID=CAMNT_0040655013 /DNA_START=81 /DNA_END=863 /DNA_ORIENTATION=-